MALVNCPECGNQVSEHANTCPNCGFGVKEHFDKEKEKQESFEAFSQNHRPFSTDNEGWFLLFSAYEFMIKRVTETTKQLEKYRTVWFDSGTPSYPIAFCNGWFECLNDTYFEIIKNINASFSTFPDAQIKENLTALNAYKYDNVVRIILARWHSLLMDPFYTNSPAILKQANHRYATELAKKSEMDFGVVTNSIIGVALYAVQSSIKKVKAENEAAHNRQSYVNNAMTSLQRNVSTEWNAHYPEFLDDVEFCHQVILHEIGDILFKGYWFNWEMVDAEYIKPAQQESYQLRKQEIEEAATQARLEEKATLAAKKDAYLTAKQNDISKLEREISYLSVEINKLGLSLFGERARKKKSLQAELQSKITQKDSAKEEYNRTKWPQRITDMQLRYIIYSGWEKYHNLHRSDECILSYDVDAERYKLFSHTGQLLHIFYPGFIEKQFGMYREFVAHFEDIELLVVRNIEKEATIVLRITDRY